MNVIQKAIRSMLIKAIGGESYTAMDSGLGRWFGGPTVSGVRVSEDSMLKVAAAWSCCRILSETIGSLPWAMYKRDAKTGNSERADEHSLSRVLMEKPNPDMTSVEFREASVLNLCQNGNAYSLIERAGSEIVSLYPMHAPCVTPQRNEGVVSYRVQESGGKVEVYPQEKIWHVKGFGRNGLVGLSPLGAAREVLGTATAMEQFGAAFFSQGGKPAGVISMPGYLQKEQRAIARENLNQMMGGLGNAHRFALFEGGMKPEPWGEMSLDDMQFIMSRKFSIQEICRFYRIPPHMVADLERATFSNIEQQSQEFVQYTLMPYFTRIEDSVSRWLLTAADRSAGYFLRFNFEGLLRADSAARATFVAQMLQNGVMTRNEVRAKENLNASDDEGMDDFTVQMNMTTIENLAAVEPPDVTEAALASTATDTSSIDKALGALSEKFARFGGSSDPYAPFNAMDAAGLKTLRQEIEEAKLILQTLTDTMNQMKAMAAKVERVDSALRVQADEIKKMRTTMDVSMHRVVEAERTTAKTLQLVGDDVRKPRAPVFDEAGNVLGSKIVDKLEEVANNA